MDQQNIFGQIEPTEATIELPNELAENNVFASEVLDQFLSYIQSHEITVNGFSNTTQSGNLNVIYQDKVVFRIRCTAKSVNFHIPPNALAYFNATGYDSTGDLKQGWKCVSYANGTLSEATLFSLYCTLIDVIKTFQKNSVGCCHLYRKCSDFKRCVIDDTYPNAADTKRDCMYRLNLLQGKIFYGVHALPDLDEAERELLKAYRYSDSERKALIFDAVSISNKEKLLHDVKQLSSFEVAAVTLNAPDSSALPAFMNGKDNANPFWGKKFVITGGLSRYKRVEAFALIHEFGGQTSDKPVSDMDVLIVGTQEWSNLHNGVASHKIIAANKLIEEGRDVKVISEDEFYKLLGGC